MPVAIDWRRVLRRSAIGLLLLLALATLWAAASEVGRVTYGFDYHGGIYKAGHDILAGRPIYGPPDAHRLAIGNAYIPPPPLAELFIPLSVLPFWASIALLNLICVGLLVAALRLLGVRDPNVYLLCLCSGPFLFSLSFGDPDALYVLLAALAWRYRDSPGGAVAAGAVIAAKLVLWPLLVWLIATRRFRNAGVAMATTAGLILASWAVIGFKGLLQYPRFLAADAKVQWTNHSTVALLRDLGLGRGAALLLALVIAAAAGLMIVRAARRSDLGWFTAAVVTGVLASAVVFPNYFVILFVPLAIARPRADRLWLLTLPLLLVANVGTVALALELLIVVLIGWRAARARDARPLRRVAAAGRKVAGPAKHLRAVS